MTNVIDKKTKQRTEALAKAKSTRIYRKTVIDAISRGKCSLEAALDDPMLATLTVSELVAVLPATTTERKVTRRSNGTRARLILTVADVRATRAVGSLTEHSQIRLLEAADQISGAYAWIYRDRTAPRLQKPRRNENHNQQQTLGALEKANEVRTRRKEKKAAMRRGEITLAEALNDPCLLTMPLGKLVVNLRRTDPTREKYLTRMSPQAAQKVLKDNGISPLAKPEALSDDGKRILVMLFEQARFHKPIEHSETMVVA